jgi:hypothetical protein
MSGKPYWGVNHVPVLAEAAVPFTPARGGSLFVVARPSPSVQATNPAVLVRDRPAEDPTAFSQERFGA